MKRLNFTLNYETVQLLDELSSLYYHGNKSRTVRAALESLATHVGHAGWVISGYTPMTLQQTTNCHTCGVAYAEGDTLYRPVFKRGIAKEALPHLPSENWLDCQQCAEAQES